MVNLTFYLNPYKKSKKTGLVPIVANFAFNYKDSQGETIYKNVSKSVLSVKIDHWSKSKQRVHESKTFEEANLKTNPMLDSMQADAKKYFSELEAQKIEITEDILRKFLNGEKLNLQPKEDDKKQFWPAYEEYLKLGELEKAFNTNRNRKTIKNKLKEFEQTTRYKMTFDRINLVFYDRLKEYILNRHDYNYLSAITDKFKAFMNWSFERNYHTSTIYKRFSAPEKEGTIVYLIFPELQTLINYQFKSERLQKANDFFCFGCLTGLRYCDLEKLTKDNISNGILQTTTQKTNSLVSVPIYEGLQTIVNRYPGQYKLLPKISNAKLNEYIKECCKLAGIDSPTESKTFIQNTTKTEFKPKHELITTHTGRKTFICLAHSRGLDIEMIKAITGITREKTLRRYLSISDDNKLEKLKNAFGSLNIIDAPVNPKPDEMIKTGI